MIPKKVATSNYSSFHLTIDDPVADTACDSKPDRCGYGTCNTLEIGFNCTCESCNCSTLQLPSLLPNLKTCSLSGPGSHSSKTVTTYMSPVSWELRNFNTQM